MSNDVFILGAGFSKAVSDNMPTLAELSSLLAPKVADLLPTDQKPSEEITSNIEMLLSYLSQDYPWQNQAQQLRNRAAFFELSDIIAKEFEERQKIIYKNKFPEWLTKLAQDWNEKLYDVITFNYDLIVEMAVFFSDVTAAIGEVGENIPQLIYPVPVTPSLGRMAYSLISGPRPKTLNLHKLHGSISWFYSGSPEYFGEQIYSKWNRYDQSGNILPEIADKVPLIIPPTMDKTLFFKNETIRKIWQSAGRAINEAQRIFCMGYSFPVTDLMVRYFMLANKPKDKVLFYWVNINKHQDGLENVLPHSFEVKLDYCGTNAIENFASDYLNGKL
jgi:hypothetical protein